jgi:hypothetical protein
LNLRPILFAIATTVFHTAFSQTEWILQKDSDSIKVYTSHAENSRFKSIKAIFSIQGTMTQLASMLLDIEKYDEWQYNTIDPVIIKKISSSELIYHASIAAPWPVSDRDMVVHLTIVQDSDTKELTIQTNSKPGLFPIKNNFVRVPMSVAKWTVKPEKESTLRVEYTIQIDPGGAVPAWMVNMVCAEAPHESFKNMREKIHFTKVMLLPFIKD